jgi:Domain of unknown function (DUF6268)
MRFGLLAILAILFSGASPIFATYQNVAGPTHESLPQVSPPGSASSGNEYSRELILPNEIHNHAVIDGESEILEETQLDHIPQGMQVPGVELESGEVRQASLNDYFAFRKYSDYRIGESMLSYLPSNADELGWLSMKSSPYIPSGTRSGITSTINLHFLSGPTSIALPPRLYDIAIGYQKRGAISQAFSYDIAASVGVFSDFEDSARDGIRYPGHAVGMINLRHNLDFVFGVDYISRDDIKLLPVVGFSWRSLSNPSLQADLIFPRPRINYVLSKSSRMYLSSVLDGGSWDIEFPDNSNDVMTYSDIKILFGVEHVDRQGDTRAWEFGYVFDRHLQFRNRVDEDDFDNAFVLRMVSRH